MVFFGDPYVVLTHPGLQVELPPLLVTAAPPLRQVDTSTNVFLGPVSQTHPTVLIVLLCLSVGLLLLLLFKKKKRKNSCHLDYLGEEPLFFRPLPSEIEGAKSVIHAFIDVQHFHAAFIATAPLSW